METRAGFIDGAEVVEVGFDPKAITFAALLDHARTHAGADTVHTTTPEQLAHARAAVGDRARALAGAVRPDREPKYYLLQTPLRHVPMTALQAARVNAKVKSGDYASLLSPRQRELLAAVAADKATTWPVAVDRALPQAWGDAQRARRARAAPPLR